MMLTAPPRLCSGCGYDLRAHPVDVPCPECNTPYLSGPIQLQGREEIPTAFSPKQWYLSFGIAAVVILMLFIKDRERNLDASLMVLVGVFTAMFAWSIFGPKRHQRPDTLSFSAAGLSLTNDLSGRTYHEPWTSHIRFEVAIAPFTDLTAEPKVQVRVDTSEPMLRFAASLDKGLASSLERQVAQWKTSAPEPADPLRIHRRCPDCLKPTCNCSAKNALELYCIPAYFVMLPKPFALAIFQGFAIQFLLISKQQSVTALLGIGLFFGLCFGLVVSLRRPRDFPSRETRFSPSGYQFCRPDAPLRLNPWRGEEFRFNRRMLGRLGLTLHKPMQLQLIRICRTLVLTDAARRQLDAKQRIWRTTPPPERGFPIG